MEFVVVAAFGAMLLWGAADFFIQRLCRVIGNLETLLLIDLSATIMLFPFVVNEIPTLQAEHFPLLILLGIIGWFSGMTSFKALNTGKLAVVDAIIVLELPFTIILGMVFFHDTITPGQWPLIFGIILGTMLVSLTSLNPKKVFSNLEKGAVMALAAAFIFGFMNFTTAAVSKEISPAMAIWFPWTVSLLVTSLIFASKKSLGTSIRKFSLSPLLALATVFTAVFGWLLYAVAVAQEELSIITAITESYVVVAVLMGVFFNKEKLALHQILAIVIVIAASILLAMTL